MSEPIIVDLEGQSLTREHFLALRKICPGAEWTYNGRDLIWYSEDKTPPAMTEIAEAVPAAVKEDQDNQTKEELIQNKIRQMAIDALKIEGKLDSAEKLIAQEELKAE